MAFRECEKPWQGLSVRVCVCGLRRTNSPFHRGCSLLQLVQEERIEGWKASEKLSTCHPEGRDRERQTAECFLKNSVVFGSCSIQNFGRILWPFFYFDSTAKQVHCWGSIQGKVIMLPVTCCWLVFKKKKKKKERIGDIKNKMWWCIT